MFTLDQAGRRRHEVRFIRPPPMLRPWVEHLVEDRRPEAERGRWRIVPDPCGHLLVSFAAGAVDVPSGVGPAPRRPGELGGAVRPGALRRITIVGARTRFVDADVTARGLTLAARFRPGALTALLGESAGALTDRGVRFATLLGSAGARLEERVGEARTTEEAIEALTALLSDLARRRREPDWRVGALSRALAARGGEGGPAALADATGMAPRTLRAVAAREVGISPRRWVRLHRLFRAMKLGQVSPALSWSWVAARAGYHDPPHLTREFRDLLGETPTSWRRRAMW